MGLDMYAYAASKAGQHDDYWENYDPDTDSSRITKPREIAYWRKHPNMHGWMEELWISKGRPGLAANCDDADVMFNGIELELTFDDIIRLEKDIMLGNLPLTSGFFFGENSDEYYKEQDLAFVYEAKSILFLGERVFYNSSW